MSDAPPALGAEQLSCPTGTRIHEQITGLGDWASQSCRLGIDEAGRGPVLGPMVYAAAYAPIAANLTTKAFADSKALSEDTRRTLYSNICSDTQMGFCSDILSAAFISSQMLARSRTSLNQIAVDSTFRIIRRLLDKGVNITEVYVDTVGDAGRYSEKLSNEFPTLAFTVCPKADALYPIVSAASIVAKVVRDAALTVAAQESGLDPSAKLGSGYPGDPDTKAWLKTHLNPVWGYTQTGLVRFSWETVTRCMLDGGCVGVSFEADEDTSADNNNNAGGKQQRLSFGSQQQAVVETSGLGRHTYFRVRKLQRATAACF